MKIRKFFAAAIAVCGLGTIPAGAEQLQSLIPPLVDHPVIQPGLQITPHQWRTNVGAWGESFVQETLKLRGFNEIHQIRKPGNQGIDHIAIKRGANGEILDARIVETKTHRGTTPKLGDTRDGRQMSEEWISKKLEDIKASEDPEIRKLGQELEAFREKKGITYQQMGEIHEINTRTGRYIRRNPETLEELSSDSLDRLLRKLQKRGSKSTRDWATRTLGQWDQIRATEMKDWGLKVPGGESPETSFALKRPEFCMSKSPESPGRSFDNPFRNTREMEGAESVRAVGRSLRRESMAATTEIETEFLEGAAVAAKRARKAALGTTESLSARCLCVAPGVSGNGGLKRLALRAAGPIALLVGFAMDIDELASHVQAYRSGAISRREMCIRLCGSVGGIGGAYAGAAIGAYIGAFGGPLAWITIPVGSTVGGIGGYFAGSAAGNAVARAYYTWVDDKVRRQFDDWLCTAHVSKIVVLVKWR